jgi:hypothetical protein
MNCSDRPGLPPDLAAMQAAGFNLLPISAAKKPLVKWRDRQETPLTLAELMNEFVAHAPPIMGNITGATSARISLDFDGEMGRATYARLGLDEPHRETPGGGLHLDVEWPADLDVPTLNQSNSVFLKDHYPGLDLKGRGGYSNVWGADHRGAYKWLRGLKAEPFSTVVELLPDLVRHLYERQSERESPRIGSPTPISSDELTEHETRRRILHALASQERMHAALLAVGRAFPDRPDEELEQVARIVVDVVAAIRPDGRPVELDEARRCIFDGAQFARERGIRPPSALSANGRPCGREIVTHPLTTFCAKKVRSLAGGRIPLGAVTKLVGRGGLGKTTLAIVLASQGSRGELEGDLYGEPFATLIVTFEDDPAVLKLRAVAAGADLSRLHIVRAVRDGEADLLTLPDDSRELGRLAEELGARLVVIDPLVAAMSGQIDSHRDQSVRRAEAPLAKMAEELDLAILATMHFNKAASTDSVTRISGSTAFYNASRSVLLFGRHPDDVEDGPRRVLIQDKTNGSKKAPTTEIQPGGGRAIRRRRREDECQPSSANRRDGRHYGGAARRKQRGRPHRA